MSRSDRDRTPSGRDPTVPLVRNCLDRLDRNICRSIGEDAEFVSVPRFDERQDGWMRPTVRRVETGRRTRAGCPPTGRRPLLRPRRIVLRVVRGGIGGDIFKYIFLK